ncbi:MAG TPA: hypothetical protein PKC54_14190 [Ferruginibacter sp.]|nr:hypothetical protein [Ferruginibacter sp.]
MKRIIFLLVLIMTGLVTAQRSYAQDCMALADNDYCIDGVLCHAEAPFPIWAGGFGLGNYFINGKLGDSKAKAGVRIYLKGKPKKSMELNTEVETGDLSSGSQVCIELVQGTKKLYATGDQKVFCTVNEDGSVTIKADKLAMAKGRGNRAEVVSYLSFNMKK